MKDIIQSIKIRLNNPFILSFLLSWIFWNWPITIGLIWYNAGNINRFGYPSYYDLIVCNTDLYNNLIYPLLSALLFLGLLPLLRLVSNFVQTWFAAKDEANVKKLSGKGFIPTMKFLELREQFEEHNKRLSDIITNESSVYTENQELKTTITEKENELTKIRADKEESDKKLKGLKEDITKAKERISKFSLSKDGKLRVIYATYGTSDRYSVVTEKLKELFSTKALILVDNETLGEDPAPNFVKELFLIYSFGEVIQDLRIIEGGSIEISEVNLITNETEEAMKKREYVENVKKLSEIFKGEWELTFQSKNGKVGSERVIIDDQGTYFVNGIKHFQLGSVGVNQKAISFVKVSLNGKRHSKETLIRMGPTQIGGSNDLGYDLKYVKK